MRRIPSMGLSSATVAGVTPLPGTREVVFSQTTPTVERSGPWTCRQNGFISELLFALGTAGTSDTTIDFEVNLTNLFTSTLVSGATTLIVPLQIDIFVDDRVTVNVTSAGAAASHLVTQMGLSY